MRTLIWLFGSTERVSYVGRAVIRTTLQGIIAAFAAVGVGTANGLSLEASAVLFAVVSIVPAVLSVAMQAIPVSREPPPLRD